MPRLASILCAVALVAACERPSEDARARALTSRVLHDMLAYPGSSLVSFAAGEQAGQVVLTTPVSPDTVIAWYRRVLLLNGWELRQDQRRPDGSQVLYAVKAERPLWITLQRTAGAPGTTYTLIGAEAADTTTARDTAQASGSSMSSNRIQRR